MKAIQNTKTGLMRFPNITGAAKRAGLRAGERGALSDADVRMAKNQYPTVRGKVQDKPGQDPVTQGIKKVAGAVGKQIEDWKLKPGEKYKTRSGKEATYK